MTGTARISIPEKLIPVFDGPADVRGAFGGRGSAKTRSFAMMTAVRAYMWSKAGIEGIILCARQYMNSLDDSSLAEVKAAIKSAPWLEAHFDIGEKYIRTKDGRVTYAFSGLDRSIASIKSKSRILLCWVDEAEPVTESAWQILIPTLREEGDSVNGTWNSELWVTWNPASKRSATHKRFRDAKDPLIKVVELNWRDNPRFPDKLERERQRDMEKRPEQYDHIWEGGFVIYVEGAYYAKHIVKARQDKRIGVVPTDPMFTIRLYCDIGGTGARADAFSIWAMQFIGLQVRCVNYYEAVGQPMSAHAAWLREQDYTPTNSQVWLPHDGAQHDKVFTTSYETAFKQLGFKVTVVPNQGAGAAAARIEAGRNLFPSIWFNEATCEAGIDALAWYHEKKDEERNIGLGPLHDWSSNGADAFGLGCITYVPPSGPQAPKPIVRPMNRPMSV